jgi:hypothetical protein
MGGWVGTTALLNGFGEEMYVLSLPEFEPLITQHAT